MLTGAMVDRLAYKAHILDLSRDVSHRYEETVKWQKEKNQHENRYHIPLWLILLEIVKLFYSVGKYIISKKIKIIPEVGFGQSQIILIESGPFFNQKVDRNSLDKYFFKKERNTIFVDNDKKKKVDVINSREKENVVEKLKLFSKEKTVTRDFSQTYKNAISEALPKAKQIVDRFHIFKNLTDDLNDYIKRNIKKTVKMIDNKEKDVIEEEIILNKRQRNKKESAERKWEVIQEVQKLYKEGLNKNQISKKMKISRQTIYSYLEQHQPLERSTHSILDPFVPMIKKLILEGKKIDEIYKEIKANGYKGKTSLFNSRLKGLRQEARNNLTKNLTK